MSDTRKDYWEESYVRHENHIFYPYEELVKFLNRFIKKKIWLDKFEEKIPVKRALDLGCGMGRQTILLEEFGIESYGIDISSKAIERAKELAKYHGYDHMTSRFIVFDGYNIPFEDNFFDLSISLGVLDSMHFDIAKKLIKELDRVTKKIAFISLISGDNFKYYREFDGEEIIQTNHEKGTVQTWYNWCKVKELISDTSWRVRWARIITEEGVDHRYKWGRYYIVLTKEG